MGDRKIAYGTVVVDTHSMHLLKPTELFAPKTKLYINFKNPPGSAEEDGMQMVTNESNCITNESHSQTERS